MDIEFSQIHEMVYMHDIVNSDSKKKPRIPLKKFLNAEKVLTQTGFAPIFPDTCYHTHTHLPVDRRNKKRKKKPNHLQKNHSGKDHNANANGRKLV